MRIAHVVTFASPDGAYGGPLTVARGQCTALAARGHDVALFASAPVDRPETVSVNGYRERLYPVRVLAKRLGFAGYTARGLTGELRRSGPWDVVHIHFSRDLVTVPAALSVRRAGYALVLQTHGMVDASRKLMGKALDLLATRRILAGADLLLSLTDAEDQDLRLLAPTANIERIGNGIVVAEPPTYAGRRREVLFVARLHPRKRPTTFVEMAVRLAPAHPDVTFALIGPDEGEGESVVELIRRSGFSKQISWEGPQSPSSVAQRMAEAKVYVLPSVGEVFPMTILEAFSAGTPVVTTSSLGIADDCVEYGAAIVTDGGVDALAAAVSLVLSSEKEAIGLRNGAAKYIRDKLDIRAVAESLEAHYRAAARNDSVSMTGNQTRRAPWARSAAAALTKSVTGARRHSEPAGLGKEFQAACLTHGCPQNGMP